MIIGWLLYSRLKRCGGAPRKRCCSSRPRLLGYSSPRPNPVSPTSLTRWRRSRRSPRTWLGSPLGWMKATPPPPQVFHWHLPEGAPDPIDVPPLQNGFHHAHEGELLDAFEAALAGFGQPPAANGQPG